ncbi:MAG: Rrf2 family transcriptional regulator [Candidatus Omnitrophica bacterium]|nr:Rrf2 family transcriptional regulator [Candidatus Omnitrophota bacterium]
MKLSTRSTYGMRALVELGLVSGKDPVSASLIARRQGLSVAYLEQLLHRLKREGLVTSVRGPRGGYVLAKDPQRITMAQVVRVLDGWDGMANGKTGKTNGKPREGQRRSQQIAHAVWRCVHERLAHSLDGVTLRDLCDEVGATVDPLEHRYVFHI